LLAISSRGSWPARVFIRPNPGSVWLWLRVYVQRCRGPPLGPDVSKFVSGDATPRQQNFPSVTGGHWRSSSRCVWTTRPADGDERTNDCDQRCLVCAFHWPRDTFQRQEIYGPRV